MEHISSPMVPVVPQVTEPKELTEQQLDVLTNFFDQCPDPEMSDLSELAKQIDYPLNDVSYFSYATASC